MRRSSIGPVGNRHFERSRQQLRPGIGSRSVSRSHFDDQLLLFRIKDTKHEIVDRVT
jgi:hypothetical protein